MPYPVLIIRPCLVPVRVPGYSDIIVLCHDGPARFQLWGPFGHHSPPAFPGAATLLLPAVQKALVLVAYHRESPVSLMTATVSTSYLVL